MTTLNPTNSIPPATDTTTPRLSRCPIQRTKRLVASLMRFGRPSSPANPVQMDSAPAHSTTPGVCPMGFGAAQPRSVFIEHAAAEAEKAPIGQGEPRANKLIEEARAMIYHWPVDFAGFSARVTIVEGTDSFEGQLLAPSSRKMTLQVPGFQHAAWLRYQIEELVSHREHPSVSRMHSRSGVRFGDMDRVYGQQVIFELDPMQSFYRLRDDKITQIGRTYGKQRFVINIDQHHLLNGRFAAFAYQAFYQASDSAALVKCETFLDDYNLIDGVYLPCSRRYTLSDHQSTRTRAIEFHDVRILEPAASVAA